MNGVLNIQLKLSILSDIYLIIGKQNVFSHGIEVFHRICMQMTLQEE